MPDDSAFTKGPSSPFDTGTKCRKCGYNLTGLPEPVRCPECGRQNHELDAEWRQKDRELGLYVVTLNTVAVVLGIWGFLSPRPTGSFGFFGPGPDVGRICCIIPVQWFLAFSALFMFVKWLTRKDDPAPIPRWLVIGTAIPFLLAIPTCLKL
jgi:hypothetical protein